MTELDTITRQIGDRLRDARKDAGMSQSALGAVMGVSFQQVQKYERGTNRISAARLYQVSRALDLSIGDFFNVEG